MTARPIEDLRCDRLYYGHSPCGNRGHTSLHPPQHLVSKQDGNKPNQAVYKGEHSTMLVLLYAHSNHGSVISAILLGRLHPSDGHR